MRSNEWLWWLAGIVSTGVLLAVILCHLLFPPVEPEFGTTYLRPPAEIGTSTPDQWSTQWNPNYYRRGEGMPTVVSLTERYMGALLAANPALDSQQVYNAVYNWLRQQLGPRPFPPKTAPDTGASRLGAYSLPGVFPGTGERWVTRQHGRQIVGGGR